MVAQPLGPVVQESCLRQRLVFPQRPGARLAASRAARETDVAGAM